jgi:cytochrome c556
MESAMKSFARSLTSFSLAGVFSLGLLSISTVHAADPENYIKYRQAIMKAIAGHSGSSGQILRGLVEAQPGELAFHADALARLNADLVRLFPEGSDFGETEALPKIWEDRAGFAQRAKDAEDATANFAKAVQSGDNEAMVSAYKAVGESCKGCHQNFRERKR